MDFHFEKNWIVRVHFFALISKLDLNRPVYKNKETRSNLEMLPPGLGSSWPEKCLKFRSGWLAVFFRTGPAPGLARFKMNPIGFVLEPFVFLWGRWIWQIPVLILLPPS